ncbi:hypothetical protein C1645_742410 [Glomus cerebriforme]|uniref:Uncharacterized protein n=1 Tax=Glomus cerebriforme TaxID=658196 RepID=A0A397SDH6_9GLOM|nr:hypothetical protein C1645_742410 [Glomus cerebriforme]
MLWRCAKGHDPCGLSEVKEIAHSRGVITNILGPPSSIRRPDFLKIPEHPRGLELNIYYPQYGFAIEVQGKQHEQHIKYFHKDPEEFEKQLMRDQLKKNFAKRTRLH